MTPYEVRNLLAAKRLAIREAASLLGHRSNSLLTRILAGKRAVSRGMAARLAALPTKAAGEAPRGRGRPAVRGE